MMPNPAEKYRPFPQVRLNGRRWPNRTIEKAPVWMSTDLRDGNQSLIEPMSIAAKLEFFEMLVKIGFKEIEVGFPSASQTDFDFVRKLIDEKRIPDDVTIEVLVQSRRELIERTFEAVEGASKVIVHLYNAIAPSFRKIVFNQSKDEVKALAVEGTRIIKECAAARPDTHWIYQYSPETFSMTELSFAREVCDAVAQMWRPTPDHKMIVNLPATVEAATPNVFADQIEWMDRNMGFRDSIVLSVHPHNDRGTAVAAAEMALLAGADRIEGCLFGNGERTGNVDLVTLAMNLYTQGVDPGLDFSDIDAVRRVVERCNQIPVHPRHPYAGDLVFTAFSGSHQDAIRKGFAQRVPGTVWEVPYLPIDPADLGRSYDAVIRVNSQSGKGGSTYLLERGLGFTPPRRVQIEFSHAVQKVTDASGAEISGEAICELFKREYFDAGGPVSRIDVSTLTVFERRVALPAVVAATSGDAHAQAVAAALGVDASVNWFETSATANGDTAAFVGCRVGDGPTRFGVAVHANPALAVADAVVSAVNRSGRVVDNLRQDEAVEA
ncbi:MULTISPECIES: 2-isopropylmalate synthase [unclassified Caballeronia]|uniref:2-isopropylmalate synthase n=1 Tax=unclassified Caballeronia TaxID=2646786 RepID=UPI0020288D6E|nr:MULTISPECIES: 2-isopropylmalate synthase [unclassified Caballeronia]MDR5764049.1 2-isopropylmalate synthase [Caballeronia sp. LZ028]MDR5785700.1 2-isopropylmalate synthase [Caballeronia sp. LP003]